MLATHRTVALQIRIGSLAKETIVKIELAITETESPIHVHSATGYYYYY